MPWTPAQHRLFQAAAHNPEIAKKHNLFQSDAARMASEGIKNVVQNEVRKKSLVKALKGY
jgi:hypothetical protein